MALGHFLMAIEGAFLFALLALIVGVGLFKGNIATQVGELYSESDLRRAMAFQIFYIFINVSVIAAPLVSGTLGQKVGWHYGFGCAGVVMVLGLFICPSGRPRPRGRGRRPNQLIGRVIAGASASPPWSSPGCWFRLPVFANWLVGRSRRRCSRSTSLTRNLDHEDGARPLALHPDPGYRDFAADQSGNFQRLSHLGRPAVQPAVHAIHHAVELADHARCNLELFDARRRRAVLEMVELQAARARRDQQDDHR